MRGLAILSCLAVCPALLANPTSYGTGCPGSGGFIPSLAITGTPQQGSTVTLSLTNGLGGSNALLFLGLAQASLPMGLGCTLNVTPLLPQVIGPLPLAGAGAGAGQFSFPVFIPPTTPAITVTLQGFVADAGAPLGFSATNGVQVDVVPVPTTPPLVINEVDYDQAGSDTAEFVEIQNVSGSTVSLSGIALSFVDGLTNSESLRVDLSPLVSVGPYGFIVVGSASVVAAVPPGTKTITIASNTIQNGAPDGIALIATSTATLLDALSYEGSITAATIPGMSGPVNLVEGTAASAMDNGLSGLSIGRSPNGTDTNDANSDWKLIQSSPGVANP